MNKKQLIIAAMATVLSVSAANATSNISGVTGVGNNGFSGTFNIDPATISGDVGYRHYTDFQLGEGDIANLIYQGMKNGEVKDLNAFINLVQNHIDVNGIVNTLRGDGTFHSGGHAIFISPNGMTVGASGVLNVGQLSVITPTTDKFEDLTKAYNAKDYATMNKVSKLRSDEATAVDSTINYGGNAPVNIYGTVLSRNGVDIRGSQINISGNILNGINNADKVTTAKQAQDLFNALVNTEGLNNGSSIIVKSGKGTETGIEIVSTANIENLNNNAEVAITNNGDKGLTFNGTANSNGKLNLYNKAGDLNVNGNLSNKNADLSITNATTANALNINGGNISTTNNLNVVNHGTDKLLIGNTTNAPTSATLSANEKVNVVNNGNGDLTILQNARLGKTDKSTTSVRIVNRGGQLAFSGFADAAESVSIRNEGTGMTVGGTVNAGEGILVHNKNGNAELSGYLEVDAGNIAVMNEGTGKLTTTTDSSISNGEGNIAIKNTADGGMELNGYIANTGEVAINNLAGAADVNGIIENYGNVGIINKDNGTGLTIGATISNEGKMKIVNSSGANGLTVDGEIYNNSGNLYLYNDKGLATINGQVTNEEAGNLYVLSRNESLGIKTSADSVISNEAGDLAIKHNGTGAAAGLTGAGMNLNGTITNSGETAINNYKGNMLVNGNINVEDGNLGIINRAGGYGMTLNATIQHNASDGTANIKNYGSGNMTVNGEITHNGRLNVLANEGDLILGGKIHNTGTDMTYAAARANGDGIDVKSTFEADASGGTILIKNITGQNGLKYEGTMTNTNGLAEVYNKVGDMTVNGDINAVGAVDRNDQTGASAVVLNTGNNLTVTDQSDLEGEVVIVNKGINKANVADKYKDKFREQLRD